MEYGEWQRKEAGRGWVWAGVWLALIWLCQQTASTATTVYNNNNNNNNNNKQRTMGPVHVYHSSLMLGGVFACSSSVSHITLNSKTIFTDSNRAQVL
jgi:hypothetical protein